MRLIATSLIDEFCSVHPNARAATAGWARVLSATSFANFNQLKKVFRQADYVAPFTIFDIGGNNYRIISRIKYQQNTVEVRWVLTHAEYDRWTRQFRSGQIKL